MIHLKIINYFSNFGQIDWLRVTKPPPNYRLIFPATFFYYTNNIFLIFQQLICITIWFIHWKKLTIYLSWITFILIFLTTFFILLNQNEIFCFGYDMNGFFNDCTRLDWCKVWTVILIVALCVASYEYQQTNHSAKSYAIERTPMWFR